MTKYIMPNNVCGFIGISLEKRKTFNKNSKLAKRNPKIFFNRTTTGGILSPSFSLTSTIFEYNWYKKRKLVGMIIIFYFLTMEIVFCHFFLPEMSDD